MKLLTMILLAAVLSLNVQAEDLAQTRQAAIVQVKQDINTLCDLLERTNSEDELYVIRLQLRNQFKKMDELVLSSPLFKNSK